MRRANSGAVPGLQQQGPWSTTVHRATRSERFGAEL
jgi:hypothetical protein